MTLQSRQCPQGYQLINGVCSEDNQPQVGCAAACSQLHPSHCGYSAFNDSCECSCCHWAYSGPPPGHPNYNPQPHQYYCSCSGCWQEYDSCITNCATSFHGRSNIGGGYGSGGRGNFGGRRTGGRIRRRRRR